MRIWFVRIQRAVPVLTLLTGLSLFGQAIGRDDLVRAHETALRVAHPYDIFVQNSGSVATFATVVDDFDKTDIEFKAGTYNSSKTNFDTMKGNFCQYATSWYGIARSYARVNNQWVVCTNYSGHLTGACGGDVKVRFARVLINTCGNFFSDYERYLGDRIYRTLLSHEFGHPLGLGHPPCNTQSVMEELPCFSPDTWITKLQTHDKSDLNGMY